jgi:hypothetical protein
MVKEQVVIETAPPMLFGTRTLSSGLVSDDEDELSIEMDHDDDDDDDDDDDKDHEASSHVASPEAAARYQQEQQLKKVQAFVKKETFRVNVSKFIVVFAIVVAGVVFSCMTYKVVHDADTSDYREKVCIETIHTHFCMVGTMYHVVSPIFLFVKPTHTPSLPRFCFLYTI